MGLCAWRDKNVYFTSGERDTKVRMLEKYLDRAKAPHVTEAPDSPSSSISGSVEEASIEQSGSASDRREPPPAAKVGKTAPVLIQEKTTAKPEPRAYVRDQDSPAFGRPSVDTPGSPPEDWDSHHSSPIQPGQDSVVSARSQGSQEDAAFVFIRNPSH